ncbi:RNA polymerase sigma factor [Oceanirhabdus seepicola]|uniref:Sigma-70 family RNA polymerase sigma factor n=1 Tax=Oceanirhabdus seepicola TaxID=2828781 RepID=A0A9J6P7N2_9CLOT|nr:sigma-70 family RNA polymerase sigma factor [Oceanirhabdus seepicola]MCM1991536.1 sigma-70 family RNA polymerase sigma factor [Oceanirhabdus seepicola]
MVELVKKAKKGDEESFSIIINNVKNKAYRVAYKYLKNEEDSMDAVCEGVVIAFKNIHTLKTPEYFETWFTKIVINQCNLQLKNRKKAEKITEMLQERMPTFKEDIHREELIIIKDKLKKMKPLDRNIIHMKFLLGYKFKDIAERLKIPESTVKTKAYKGIKELQKEI